MSSSMASMRPRTGWLAVGALAGLALTVAFGPALLPKAARAVDPATTTPEHTISVGGVGTVQIPPDVADVSVGVDVTRSTVKEARPVAATQMTAVIAALKKAGVADRDIQTSGLSINAVYDYNNNSKPRITGYQVSNTVTATVRNLDTVSDVVDGAIAAGANQLNGLTFRVDDPKAAEAQARDAAVKDARAKADALARAAGVSITGVQSIVESSAPTPQPIYMDRMAAPAAADSAKTPIQVGTNDVMVTVNIVYLID
jgi:uncharacterized protein YggE